MISLADFQQVIADLLDELPEEFFRELTGGVVVSEAALIPDYAQADDLYTMGQYSVFSGVRQIVIYKGCIPMPMRPKRKAFCAAWCAMSSAIIWRGWAAFIMNPPWKPRTRGTSRRILRGMASGSGRGGRWALRAPGPTGPPSLFACAGRRPGLPAQGQVFRALEAPGPAAGVGRWRR